MTELTTPSPHKSATIAVAQSTEVARQGAIATIENAARHLRCADAIARRRDYGMARGHLVLATEEAIKGCALSLRALDFDIPNRQLEALLYRHDARHGNAIWFMLLAAMMDSVWTSIQAAQARYPNPTASEKEAMRKEAVAGHIAWVERQAQLPPESDSLHLTLNWLSEGNERRNAAFYVDLVDDKWESPGSVSQAEFKQDRVIARRVVSTISERAVMLLDADESARKKLHKMHDQMLVYLSSKTAPQE